MRQREATFFTRLRNVANAVLPAELAWARVCWTQEGRHMSLSRGIAGRVMTGVLATGAIAAGVLSQEPAHGQTPSWTPPYTMILTSDRALAFVQAADRKLDHLPGEVIVKFKAGVTAAG